MRVRGGIVHQLCERGVSNCFGLISQGAAELFVSLAKSNVDYFKDDASHQLSRGLMVAHIPWDQSKLQ
jgi:hypothetical protein